MIATDADKGYVWFGKNGDWYLSDGTKVSCTTANPSTGPGAPTPTGWAAIMDGASEAKNPVTTPSGGWDRNTAQPQYFPCVSYRMGPGEVNVNYTTAKLKYAPPGGFKVYGQTTIALP